MVVPKVMKVATCLEAPTSWMRSRDPVEETQSTTFQNKVSTTQIYKPFKSGEEHFEVL